MGDANPICTLRDYSRPSYEGYRNTIELPAGNNVENLFLKLGLDLRTYSKKSFIMASTFGFKSKSFMTMSIGQWDFAKLVKAISLPQDVLSTSDRRLIELENQVQRLMEAHLAPKQPIQVNKITSSCEICSGPYDTQYCMENPEQAFVDYASSRTDEAGGKCEMTNIIDTVLKAITDRIAGALPSDTVKNSKLNVNSTSLVLSARSYLTVDPQCLTQIHSSINTIMICPKRLGISQTGKLEEEEKDEKDSLENINTNPSSPPNPSVSFITKKVHKLNSFFESLGLVPQSSYTEFVCTKGDDGDVMFIEIIKKNDDSHKGEPEVGNFTYVIDFMIVEDISSIIDSRLSQVVLGKPFVEISNMTHDPPEGVVRFTNGTDKVAYKMPHKIEQYNSLSDLEREHTKSFYLMNEEDKRRGVEYTMSKIL
ncbi:hypothetical protein Tco_1164043 [Tanacetum coccineum]